MAMPIFAVSPVVPAQQVVSTKAGIVYYVEGDVHLNSKDFKLLLDKYPQMQVGQILSTKQGRAEVILAPNALLRLGESSALQMEQNRIGDVQLKLMQGSALIEIIETIHENHTQVSLLKGVVGMRKAGLYRVDVNPSRIRVYGGEAVVTRSGKRAIVKSGRIVHLDGNLNPSGFGVTVADSLHQWAGKRSFDLFLASTDSRKQTHWYIDSLGWLVNSNYHMRFYSQSYHREWAVKQWQEWMERNRTPKTTAPETGIPREEMPSIPWN